jgi:hypothetical protein
MGSNANQNVLTIKLHILQRKRAAIFGAKFFAHFGDVFLQFPNSCAINRSFFALQDLCNYVLRMRTFQSEANY